MRTSNLAMTLLHLLFLAGCGSQTLATMAPPSAERTLAGLPYYLPRAYVPITFKGGPPPKDASGKPTSGAAYQLDISVGSTIYVGDPGAPLFLAYRHSSWADDQFSLAVDQNGLLQTTSTTATDQTSAVALKVVEIIGDLAEAATGLPVGNQGLRSLSQQRPAAAKPVTCNLPQFTKVVTFFPDESMQSQTLSGTGDQSITISVTPDATPGRLGPANLAPAYFGDAEQAQRKGVVFRRPQVAQYNISIHPSPKAATACGLTTQDSVQFATIPDRSASGLYWEDVSRGALVKKSVKLSITNGMLTGVDVNNPSEVLAGVTLPADILKALLSIPSSVLNFKVQQMTSQEGVTDAQVKAIQSQIDLLQKRAALQQTQATAATNGTAQ